MRCAYAGAFLAVVLLGLLSRSHRTHLPPGAAKYLGDALWGALVYLGFRALSPKAKSGRSALWALAFSYTIETTQLYHAPWIESLRATRLGHLVFGSTFNWPDFGAYTIGVLFAWGIDTICLGRPSQ